MKTLAIFCTIVCGCLAIYAVGLGLNEGYDAVKRSGWEERDRTTSIELADLGGQKDLQIRQLGRDLQSETSAHARTRAIFSAVMLGLAQLETKDRPYVAGLGFEVSGFTVGHDNEQVAYEYTRDASGKITGMIELGKKK